MQGATSTLTLTQTITITLTQMTLTLLDVTLVNAFTLKLISLYNCKYATRTCHV